MTNSDLCVTLLLVPLIGDFSFMRKSTLPKFQRIFKKHGLELTAAFLIVALGTALVFPPRVYADELKTLTAVEQYEIALRVAEIQNSSVAYGSFPVSKEKPAVKTITVTATAYTSEVWQTDATPFITASGTTVRHGVIAANFLPIGTRVRMPEIYGHEIFIVEDRMNPRYFRRIDIWMDDLTEARAFGVQQVKLEIFQR